MGFHDVRIPGVHWALFDVMGTIALVVATTAGTRAPWWLSTAGWLAAAVALHTAFRVPARLLVL